MAAESAFVLSESGKLLVEPYIEELPELFVGYVKRILQVGYEIPRLEYYMSQGEWFECLGAVFCRFFVLGRLFAKIQAINYVLLGFPVGCRLCPQY